MVGLGSERFKQSMFSEYMETMNQLEDVDLYQGVNREIFRKGVAVTSAAMATNNHSELQEYLFGNTSQSRDVALIAAGAGLGFTLLGAGCLWISNGANQAANVTGNDIVDIIDEMEGNNK